MRPFAAQQFLGFWMLDFGFWIFILPLPFPFSLLLSPFSLLFEAFVPPHPHEPGDRQEPEGRIRAHGHIERDLQHLRAMDERNCRSVLAGVGNCPEPELWKNARSPEEETGEGVGKNECESEH